MIDPDGKVEGAEDETIKLNEGDPNTTTVKLDLDDSKAYLIPSNANGGAGGGDHPDEYKTAIVDPATASSDGDVTFNGLGKEEVMRYANDPFWVRLRWILFILFWVGWLAMLVTAIAIIVLAPRCPPRPDLKWYQTDTIYQVYAKSFKDSNDDGVGDFGGLKDKLDYLTDDLKVNAIWLNSVIKGDGSTRGVVDHKVLDESFDAPIGNFRSWLKKLRKEGKKVILDLIPNQTSKNHTWFLKSKGKDDHYKDYYIWHEAPKASPPNNWLNDQGDPAWTFDTDRGAWYYHQFSSDQPDLNLRNEEVVNEIKDIMKFWMEAGISGFYIQDVEYLVENEDHSVADDSDKNQTRNHEGTYTFLEELRKLANAYSDKPGREKVLIATVRGASRNQTLEYFGADDMKRLHIVAPMFEELRHSDNAEKVKMMVEDRLLDETKQWLGLQLGNEYVSRIASRLDDGSGDGEYRSRLMGAHALQLLLPGTPINYYGDEFGQRNGPKVTTPMQWNTQKNAGFTGPDVTPWQPVGSDYEKDNVMMGTSYFTGKTPLEAFQELVELRGKESFQWGKTQTCTPNENLLLFTRKATRFPFFLTLINLSDKEMPVSRHDLECVSIKDEGTVRFHSRDEEGKELKDKTLNFKDYGLKLHPFDIIVVEFPSDD